VNKHQLTTPFDVETAQNTPKARHKLLVLTFDAIQVIFASVKDADEKWV
jgi:NifU-like protein involved in Fe-S cluster formation